MLLRRVIGDALRSRRQGQQRTLREISSAANVSLGYLSEIERGQKEASSELLAAICEALGFQLSEVLREASDSLARAEGSGEVTTEPVLAESAAEGELPGPRPAAETPLAPQPARAVSDGQVRVSIRRDGPLRTTLRAVRTRDPGQRVTRTG